MPRTLRSVLESGPFRVVVGVVMVGGAVLALLYLFLDTYEDRAQTPRFPDTTRPLILIPLPRS